MSARLCWAFALILAISLPATSALVLRAGQCDATTIPDICVGPQPANTYCWPCSTSMYVVCDGAGNGVLRSCPSGRKYDYGLRRCLPASRAITCTNWRCPSEEVVMGTQGLSLHYGDGLGVVPANGTLPITQPGMFYVVCPTAGHCAMGMIFRVTAETPRAGYTPRTHTIKDWDEKLTNADLYPKRYPDLSVYVGDSIFFDWDSPIHAVTMFKPTATTPTITGPAQPVYKCPVWPLGPQDQPAVLPGETRLGPAAVIGNATYTPNTTDDFWVACPVGPHCRSGMVFKVSVDAAPAGYVPQTHTISFNMGDYNNFIDRRITLGDSIFLHWESEFAPPGEMNFFGFRVTNIQYHTVAILPYVEEW